MMMGRVAVVNAMARRPAVAATHQAMTIMRNRRAAARRLAMKALEMKDLETKKPGNDAGFCRHAAVRAKKSRAQKSPA